MCIAVSQRCPGFFGRDNLLHIEPRLVQRWRHQTSSLKHGTSHSQGHDIINVLAITAAWADWMFTKYVIVTCARFVIDSLREVPKAHDIFLCSDAVRRTQLITSDIDDIVRVKSVLLGPRGDGSCLKPSSGRVSCPLNCNYGPFRMFPDQAVPMYLAMWRTRAAAWSLSSLLFVLRICVWMFAQMSCSSQNTCFLVHMN